MCYFLFFKQTSQYKWPWEAEAELRKRIMVSRHQHRCRDAFTTALPLSHLPHKLLRAAQTQRHDLFNANLTSDPHTHASTMQKLQNSRGRANCAPHAKSKGKCCSVRRTVNYDGWRQLLVCMSKYELRDLQTYVETKAKKEVQRLFKGVQLWNSADLKLRQCTSFVKRSLCEMTLGCYVCWSW